MCPVPKQERETEENKLCTSYGRKFPCRKSQAVTDCSFCSAGQNPVEIGDNVVLLELEIRAVGGGLRSACAPQAGSRCRGRGKGMKCPTLAAPAPHELAQPPATAFTPKSPPPYRCPQPFPETINNHPPTFDFLPTKIVVI